MRSAAETRRINRRGKAGASRSGRRRLAPPSLSLSRGWNRRTRSWHRPSCSGRARQGSARAKSRTRTRGLVGSVPRLCRTGGLLRPRTVARPIVRSLKKRVARGSNRRCRDRRLAGPDVERRARTARASPSAPRRPCAARRPAAPLKCPRDRTRRSPFQWSWCTAPTRAGARRRRRIARRRIRLDHRCRAIDYDGSIRRPSPAP